MAAKVTIFYSFRFRFVELRDHYVFSAEIHSLSQTLEKIKLAMKVLIIESLENDCKNISTKISLTIRVNGGYIEQYVL